MAATLTVTKQSTHQMRLTRLAWTSHTDGVVTGLTAVLPPGWIHQVGIAPGTSSVQPTNAYNLTLLDEDGIDLLRGEGVVLSNTVGKMVMLGDIWFNGGTVAPSVTGAGSGKSGVLVIVAF